MLCQQLLLPVCFVLLLRSFQQDSTCAGCRGLGGLARATSKLSRVAKVTKVAKTLVRKHPRIALETALGTGGAIGVGIGVAVSNSNPGGDPNPGPDHEGPDPSTPTRDDDSSDDEDYSDGSAYSVIIDEDDQRAPTRTTSQVYSSLGNGWITPYDGYKYKRTPYVRSWSETRRVCQSWGGDLVHLADVAASARSTILRLLSTTSEGFWIDLGENFEGICCVNGVPASSSRSHRVSIRNDDDSGFLNICGPDSNLRRQKGVSCNSRHYGICEKVIS